MISGAQVADVEIAAADGADVVLIVAMEPVIPGSAALADPPMAVLIMLPLAHMDMGRILSGRRTHDGYCEGAGSGYVQIVGIVLNYPTLFHEYLN